MKRWWLLWGTGTALSVFVVVSSVTQFGPESVRFLAACIGGIFILGAVVHQVRRERSEMTFMKPYVSPLDNDEVRGLTALLTQLVGADDLGFPLRVTGSLGGRYLLRFDTVANVQPLTERGFPLGYRLCAFAPVEHPNPYIRIYTSLLAQVLMLTTDEGRFLRVARRAL